MLCGDGECDEPETLGSISKAGREKLDNLIFVVNCNLQRLDGPVRGNGKIIQELEGIFRGADWNVIKVVWGRMWDPLFDKDEDGVMQRAMDEICDGDLQNYTSQGPAYTRKEFFGKYPELAKIAENLSDDDINKLNRGGHDPYKVYAAYHKAVHEANGKPTVILAHTIKGYGFGAAGEAQNTAHSLKKLDKEASRPSGTVSACPQGRRTGRYPLLPASSGQPGNGLYEETPAGPGRLLSQASQGRPAIEGA